MEAAEQRNLDIAVRVLHILDHSLPLHSGYTFRTRAILKAQVALGWDVASITGLRHSANGPPMEVVDGLTFYRTPPRGLSRSPFGEMQEVRAWRKAIAALVDDWRPDILHAHSPVLGALAALPVARAKGLPLLYEIRAFWEDAAVGNGTGTEGSIKYRVTRAL